MNNLVETQTKNEVKSLDECLVISEKAFSLYQVQKTIC